MGRDKARLRLGRRTLLGHVRAVAAGTGLKVRVIRRDLLPRCGSLGGIHTGLKTSHHEAEVFLSCDMPFVTQELIAKLLRTFVREGRAIFVEHRRIVGFPFILAIAHVRTVEKEIAAKRLSLHNLAARLKAKRLRLPRAMARQLFNVNTPADWQEARKRRSELRL